MTMIIAKDETYRGNPQHGAENRAAASQDDAIALD
jgi:hypothetical protein